MNRNRIQIIKTLMVRVRFYNSIIESVQMKERVCARNDKLEIWIYILKPFQK